MSTHARNPSPTRAVSIGAGAIAALLALAVLASTLSHRQASGQRARRRDAEAWDSRAGHAFGPLARLLPQVANDVGRWRVGALPAAQLAPELSAARTTFVAAQAAVDRLSNSPAGPEVNRLYRQSAALDVLWIDAIGSALDLGPGPLADQVALLGERVRELGDRVFDQGRLALGRLLPTTTQAGIDIVHPSAVPQWQREGLAPGPPLDAGGTATGASAPSLADVTAALDRADLFRLAGLAARFSTATELGRRTTDEPTLLSWLVAAEAARAGEASTLVGGDGAARLASLGRRLAVVAGQVR